MMADVLTALAGSVGLDALRLLAIDICTSVQRWVIDGYDRAPALMAGLAVLALIPPLALAGFLFNQMLPAQSGAMPNGETIRTQRASTLGLGRPRAAWIVLDGAEPIRHPVPREMLSFGREQDNDIRLEHATVHRHHAVLHRTPEAHFVIRDLSGPKGNGVKVNGVRVAERALVDGDRIEIGAAVLRFEAQIA